MALIAGLAWLGRTPATAGWELGAAELGNAGLFGVAAVAAELRPGSTLSRRLAAFAQLAMVLAVVIRSAIGPDLRLIAAGGAPTAVIAAVLLIKPNAWERWRWFKVYVFVCAMSAGILVTIGALFVAAIVFGTRG